MNASQKDGIRRKTMNPSQKDGCHQRRTDPLEKDVSVHTPFIYYRGLNFKQTQHLFGITILDSSQNVDLFTRRYA
uniref:Uncharacterized protein n=1 Tax=Onchocerca volvulus TaxID=6282 RepID=A0A8R1XPV4_ONCVO